MAPRYRRMAEALRQAILNGTYAPGAQLPTETELAEQFDVSRGTVIKGVGLLVSEGIVTRRQGAGSFVSVPSLRRNSSRLLSFAETIGLQGRRSGQAVLSFRPASDEEARAYGVSEASMLLERLRYVDGAPCAIHRSLVPQRLFDAMPPNAVGRLLQGGETDFSLYAALEASGVVFERGHERVSARLAVHGEADALGLAMPAALIVVVRQSHGEDGRMIEATEAVYPSEFYTYEVDLLRGSDLAAAHRLRVAS